MISEPNDCGAAHTVAYGINIITGNVKIRFGQNGCVTGDGTMPLRDFLAQREKAQAAYPDWNDVAQNKAATDQAA